MTKTEIAEGLARLMVREINRHPASVHTLTDVSRMLGIARPMMNKALDKAFIDDCNGEGIDGIHSVNYKTTQPS